MNSKGLKEKAGACHKQLKAILEQAGENPLSDDQKKLFDDIKVERDSLMDRAKLIDSLDADEGFETPERKSSVDRLPNEKITVKNVAEDDPKRGFCDIKDYLKSIVKTYQTRQMDDRLKPLQNRSILSAAGSDEMSTQMDPYGGFLVPESFSTMLLTTGSDPDPMGSRVMMVPMGTPTVNIPARVDKDHRTSVTGGLIVRRRVETQKQDPTRMELENVKLTAESLIGTSFSTEELMQDSPQSIAALLSSSFQTEFTSKKIQERIDGTGVGMFLGALNSPATITIAKETSPAQPAGTILAQNIINMRSRCWGYSNAIWIANHDTLPQLLAAVLESPNNAGITTLYYQSLREDRPDTLMGRPIFYSEYAKTLGSRGDLILADWSQFLEGEYTPLESAESVHVRFEEHQRVFKFTQRNAGEPWWRTTLTPKNSTTTLSPFVVIEDRV